MECTMIAETTRSVCCAMCKMRVDDQDPKPLLCGRDIVDRRRAVHMGTSSGISDQFRRQYRHIDRSIRNSSFHEH